MAIEYLTMTEAIQFLGVSRPTIWRLVKEGILPSFEDPLDKRKKLVRKDDLNRLRRPH